MNRHQHQRINKGQNEQCNQIYNAPNYQIGSPNYTTTTTMRLNDLTNILQDTNKNLKDIDGEIFSDKNCKNQNTNLQNNRNNRCRSRTNQSCDYYSDHSSIKYFSRSSMSENEDDCCSVSYDRLPQTTNTNSRQLHKSGHRRRNILFSDDMNESLQKYHHNRNTHHRDVSFHDYEKQDRFYTTSTSSNNNNSEKGLELMLENRLKSVCQKIKLQRDCAQSKNNMKIIIDQMSKQPISDNTCINGTSNLHQMIIDAEKNKAQTELLQAKRRLQELEESKHSLATEVQFLKEQLNKFDSTSHCNIRQANTDVNGVHIAMPVNTMQNIPQCLIKEIEFLKEELARATSTINSKSKSVVCENSTDVLKAIEKYEKQKDVIADHNQALKVLLKEKEKVEGQLQAEVIALKDRNNQLEVGNFKLQADMDSLYARFNDLSNECEKYMGYLRTTEEQLNLSEKKRDELKIDAQETIKLWKTKVKKLEKSLERYKNESEKLGEQNNGLIGNFNNLSQQIDSKNQEASVLREINSNLQDKLKNMELEAEIMRTSHEKLKEQNNAYLNDLNETKNLNKTIDLRLNDFHNEKLRLERQVATEENRSYDTNQKLYDMQNELESVKNERKELKNHLQKLEIEMQKLKNTLSNLEQSEQNAKSEMNSISKHAIQNKEKYDEHLCKLNIQLQQSQFQLQKVKMEYEDKLRCLQSQAMEDKSNLDYFKNMECENLKEIEQLKSSKRRLEDDYFDLNDKLDKFIQADACKARIIKEYDEKKVKLANEINLQKNEFFSKETEYLKILNLLDVEVDIILGMITSNCKETYKPLFTPTDDTNKSSNIYLLIKHKINWFGKSLEEMFQKQAKLQQNLKFLELEYENMRKSNDSNLKTQNYFLRNLENQNNELMSERAIALKNMELLQSYLHSLNESLKNYSYMDIEKSHHIHAAEHVQNLCSSQYLSDNEKTEINKRFKSYKKTIDDIKKHLDITEKREQPKFISSSVSSFNGNNSEYRKVEKKLKKSQRPAFKC